MVGSSEKYLVLNHPQSYLIFSGFKKILPGFVFQAAERFFWKAILKQKTKNSVIFLHQFHLFYSQIDVFFENYLIENNELIN